MAYVDFPEGLKGQKERKKFWLSDEGQALMTKWRRDGVTLADIAQKYIGVSMTTFWNWYKESDEMRRSLANAKEIADADVEDALYRRACGYDWWEETHELVEGEMRLIRKVKRHVSPDTKAIMQWLFNRLPNVWRAQQEPLENTQYTETIKEILVAMKEVAETGETKQIEVKDNPEE
jgi:hypothetical protein